MKKRLQVNVSGGRTSAYMAHWLRENKSSEYEMVFIFANTGFEHPDTLRFLNDVDKHFGLGLIWVESVVNPGRRGTTHKIVSFETANRNGQPFRDVIEKYGLPNQSYKHCNREMKFNPMTSYIRKEKGWKKGTYDLALGIRSDEKRRVSETAENQRVIYPLVHMNPVDKSFILDWFKQFEWDLTIPEYLGNCLTCYKKSDKKLNLVYQYDPLSFNFFREMERKFGDKKPPTDPTPGPRKIFRNHRSVDDMINLFNYVGSVMKYDDEMDSGGCSESCEGFEMTSLALA